MVRKSVREAKLPGDHITLPALPEKLPVLIDGGNPAICTRTL